MSAAHRRVSGAGSPSGSSPGLSPRNSTSKDGSKEKDGSGGRMAKMRAAMHIGSVYDDWPMYSANGDDYIVGDVIGIGASSVVHQGIFKPLNKACAIKIIDLEAYGRDTEELRRETQLMSLSKHPNVLRVRGCWVQGAKLHIATRLMSSGSMLDIMRYSSPDGFDETVIATVLKQALEGLNYLHVNGWLHRDLKAANILVDDDGTVLLGDFGVGVFVGETDKLSGSVSSEGKRKSFVGTPCWMAPEVIERKHYGTKADIWSFGITALELAQGRAPNSRLNPVKVLLHTMQDEPPKLDRQGGAHKYSKLLDDFVCSCLQKDPEKRPTAEKLLCHGLFKQAKPPKYLVTAILAGLPPLATRQERRRMASAHSTQHHLSWDFDTIHSRTTTPNLERIDPFRNFTGVVSVPSPHGSVRSTKLVSFDGQHVMATEEDSQSLRRRFESADESSRKEPFLQNSYGRRRNRSIGALSHSKSVSFEGVDEQDDESDLFGSTTLAPIGEKSSPTTGPVCANGDDVASLKLSSEAESSAEASSPMPVNTPEMPHRSASVGSGTSSSPKISVSTPATSAPSSVTAAEPEQSKPVSQSMLILQRTASDLRNVNDKGTLEAQGKPSKRDSLFGKLFRSGSVRKGHRG